MVSLALCCHVKWHDSSHLHLYPVWKLSPALFKESCSPWWCQNCSPAMPLFMSNTKSQVAVSAYSGKDKKNIQGIFKAPYLLYVIFIFFMSMANYSQVPTFLNPPKIQSSTKTYANNSQVNNLQDCFPCPHQAAPFLHSPSNFLPVCDLIRAAFPPTPGTFIQLFVK